MVLSTFKQVMLPTKLKQLLFETKYSLFCQVSVENIVKNIHIT